MKTFSTTGTGSGQTLSEIESDKIPVYDTKTDAESDLANLTVGQIIATKDEGNETSTPVDVVEDGNMHAVTSNTVADYVDTVGYHYVKYPHETLTGGKWIDGKPIYRKVIDCGALPNNTTKYVTTGLDFTVCNVVRFEGFAKNTRSSDSTSVIQISYGTSVLPSVMKDGTIGFGVTGDWTNFSQCYVIIEYTKTTD